MLYKNRAEGAKFFWDPREAGPPDLGHFGGAPPLGGVARVQKVDFSKITHIKQGATFSSGGVFEHVRALNCST